ncbi:MAG: hypothetical protein FWG02_07615 [Holophagaceae bacterium]|nr:hypothetical protein [Holophagaceae bacterium]
MNRGKYWFPPIALLAVAMSLDIYRHNHGVCPPYPLYQWLLAPLLYSMVSLSTDYLWRAYSNSLPVYKRHFGILGILLLVISIKDWYVWQTVDLAYTWCGCVVGSVVGLCLSGLPMVFGSRSPSLGWKRGTNKRPGGARPLIVVADPHWSNELTGLQEATFVMPKADWLFLGDVFDVWVGIKGFETDAQRNFIWWVSERRRTGCWVGLWLGNREYFMDSLAEKFDYIGEGTQGYLQGESLVFEHGDWINTKDKWYRLWNFCSRSTPVWLFANLLPTFIGTWLSTVLERKLKTTNREYKVNFPTQDFQSAVDSSDGDVFIVGHFHIHQKLGKGLSIPWANDGHFLIWQDGKFKFYDFNPNKNK